MKVFGIINSKITCDILENYFIKSNIEYIFFDSWFTFKNFIDGDAPNFIIIEYSLIEQNDIKMSELLETKMFNTDGGPELIVIDGENIDELKDKYQFFKRISFINDKNRIVPYIENSIISKNIENVEEIMKFHLLDKEKNILFVDDSLLMHTHINKLFEMSDYKIIHAYNGLEGYDKFTEFSPCLVITDLEMPVMNGKKLCKMIKEKSIGKFIPLIVLTSSTDEIDMETTYNYGADDYLTKPISSVELLNKVNEYFCYKMKEEKILIVDESKMVREILTHKLFKRGYRAYQASNNKDGVEMAIQLNPEIIIVNHEMPHVNGYDFIREVKSYSELSDCKIVVIGSLNSRYDLKIGESLGVEKYFVKPFDSNQVMLEIEHLVKEKYKEINIENKYMLRSIESLIKALEERDKYTEGHTQRVTRYAVMLSRFMKLGFEEVEEIRLAAGLHDIGKIGISDRVLLKEGELTDDEYDIIKTHVDKGTEILKPIKSLESVIVIIRHHHERWDGNGYPDKLKGEQIPLGSRIISVADAYDAITSNRPYRKKRSIDEALNIITSDAGTHFDKVVAEAFVNMMKSGSLLKKLKEEIEIEIEDEKII